MWKNIWRGFGNYWRSTSSRVNNNMMTLRESIHHVLDRGAQAHIHATLYNVYYRERRGTFPEVMSVYSDVMAEILELDGVKTDDHIVLNNIIDKCDKTHQDIEVVDVCCWDSVEDETYAMDMMDWNDIVDMLIEDRIGLSVSDQVAHVLWEITFWGFTRDKIAEEREKTKRAAEEAVEELKSLDDLRAALDDLE